MVEVTEKLHYRVLFDTTDMTPQQIGALHRAESNLLDAGIIFDTGSSVGPGGGVRNWEWDWSLKGPVSIESTPHPSDATVK